MENFFVDYKLFIKLCYKLLDELKESGKRYKAILCPLKGGYYLSYFLSRHLNLPMVYIEITSYKGMERRGFQIGIKPDLSTDIFLLCDDIYDSGKTVKKIHSLYPHVIFDTACLINKKQDAEIYYGRLIGDEWVDFFWEVM